jgi:hypothetical protein
MYRALECAAGWIVVPWEWEWASWGDVFAEAQSLSRSGSGAERRAARLWVRRLSARAWPSRRCQYNLAARSCSCLVIFYEAAWP